MKLNLADLLRLVQEPPRSENPPDPQPDEEILAKIHELLNPSEPPSPSDPDPEQDTPQIYNPFHYE